MVIFKLLLYPFAILYNGITQIRNALYHAGYLRSHHFQIAVVSVGNLSLGGSGKTPMIEYLIRLLVPDRRAITLSRGYGRKTKGFRVASGSDDAQTLGDEPFQLFRKFAPAVKVAVAEQRAPALKALSQQFPDTDVFLLDDAFQHRPVVPRLSVLLTEYNAPFYRDFVLPAGRLRESRGGAARADVVVVTKCPADISDETRTEIRGRVQRYAGAKPVFFSSLVYDSPIPFHPGEVFNPSVILVSGIADPTPFDNYATARFKVIRHFRFADHHDYSAADLEVIARYYKGQPGTPSILTTEKDMVKLIGCTVGPGRLPWFYIPVALGFIGNGADFDALITRTLTTSNH